MTDQHPTPEQIERYIEWADTESGPFCTDEWVEAVRQHLRQWVASAERHRATPEQWAAVEEWATKEHRPHSGESCLLELRARVEALEAAQQQPRQPHQDKLDRLIALDREDVLPVGQLVDRVAKVVGGDRKFACDAIDEVSAWLAYHGYGSWTALARETLR